MKYIVRTFGKLCHYQFSDINEMEVNKIERGEMDYLELVESFLLDRCSLENEKVCIDDQVNFEVFDLSNIKILGFDLFDIEQRDDIGTSFCPEPLYNEDFKNCLGSLDFYIGGGPVFEIESTDELKIENFTYNLFTIELDDGDISLLDDLHYNTKKLECIDFGESSGRNGILKIWKKSGEIFKIK